MNYFSTIIFTCTFALTLNLIMIFINKKSFVILINAILLISISIIATYKSGVLADEFNLVGSGISFVWSVINIIIFVLIVIVFMKKYDKANDLKES